MDPDGRIRRSRGVVCGVLLLLIGIVGGLGPLVGPYVDFGFKPDQAWHLSDAVLYYSVIPGAAVAVGGIFAILTRSRVVGVLAGLLAALGGAWFGLGQVVGPQFLNLTAVLGDPIGAGGSTAAPGSLRAFTEQVGLFSGLALLAAFVGAVAIGRFSLLAASDVAASDGYYSDFPASSQLPDQTTATFTPPA